jgi:hypothetical protein
MAKKAEKFGRNLETAWPSPWGPQDQNPIRPLSEIRPAVTDSFARDRLLSFAATWI